MEKQVACTLYGRVFEHARGHKNKQDENSLFKYDETVHEGEKQEYIYISLKVFFGICSPYKSMKV